MILEFLSHALLFFFLLYLSSQFFCVCWGGGRKNDYGLCDVQAGWQCIQVKVFGCFNLHDKVPTRLSAAELSFITQPASPTFF